MRCVLELCAFVLGVWCTCAAFAQIVRHPLVNVVDIAGVRRPVLCAGAVHACVVALASPMLALRAPVMYALAVHAFVIARLHFPCSRCVHLLCVPLLCVPALCAFVWCVVCLCSARLHRVALVDVADTTSLEDPALAYIVRTSFVNVADTARVRRVRLHPADFAHHRRRHPLSRPPPHMHPNDSGRCACLRFVRLRLKRVPSVREGQVP